MGNEGHRAEIRTHSIIYQPTPLLCGPINIGAIFHTMRIVESDHSSCSQFDIQMGYEKVNRLFKLDKHEEK